MNCPVCSSEIQPGTKYCPVCGTDVEGAQLRMQQAAVRNAPTQRMPVQGAAPQPRNAAPANPMAQGRAVPMNSSMPAQDPGRSFDTSKMNSAPKWPIVLIVILALVVIALAVLLAVRSCSPQPGTTVPADSGTVNTPVSTPDSSGTAGTAPVVDNSTTSQPQTSADNDAAYNELVAVYDQLGAFADRIQSVVDFCNNYDPADVAALQAELATAQALQSEIGAQGETLAAMQLAEGSPYAESLATMKTLNGDLAGRVTDLVDGLQQWVNGQEADAFGRNNENGQSVYKTEYEALYPNARPVQQ